jgi:predicted AlkP superfamily pyrophosphatase or phosphodiesterase
VQLKIAFYRQVSDQIVNVDQQIEALLQGMEESGILGCVDVMIVSDHGMAATPEEPNVLFIKDYVPDLPNTARVYDGVLPTIRPYNDSQGKFTFKVYRSSISHLFDA